MKRTVRETLKRAVEQLFVRLHVDLISEIHPNTEENFNHEDNLVYDDTNPKHKTLIALCKEKIGYAPLATNQDIFFSIMRVYVESQASENSNISSARRLS